MSVPVAEHSGELPASRLRSRVEAEAYVASVCFKHGPPRRVGVELEWTVHHAADARRPLDATLLAEALGPHTPPTLAPESSHLPLPSGSVLTVEPGGQVEVSSQPHESVVDLFTAVRADSAYVTRLLDAHGLVLGDRGTDSHRRPRRVLDVPRYAAMEAAFDRIGLDGRLMMCTTAGVQVCLDAGERSRLAERWRALHLLGPVMMAVFANSPRLFGRVTGWQSARMRALLGTDPPRTRPGPVAEDPAGRWAQRVLDTPLVCVRRSNGDWTAPSGVTFADWIRGALTPPATTEDLDYHLTTLFPPVRPRGYFEVRYLDAQRGSDWMLAAAVLIALFESESSVDEVLDRAAPAGGRWLHAAHRGLADPCLARSARGVLDMACERLHASGTLAGLAEPVAELADRKLTSESR